MRMIGVLCVYVMFIVVVLLFVIESLCFGIIEEDVKF